MKERRALSGLFLSVLLTPPSSIEQADTSVQNVAVHWPFSFLFTVWEEHPPDTFN